MEENLKLQKKHKKKKIIGLVHGLVLLKVKILSQKKNMIIVNIYAQI